MNISKWISSKSINETIFQR